MKENKTIMYLIILLCFSNIFGLFSYIKVTNYENELLSTQSSLENIRSDVNQNTSNIIACKVELQDKYDILYNEVQDIKFSYINLMNFIDDTKTKETVSNRWGITLTDDEVELLAHIVMLEAGNESVLGKYAVIEVVFNRMYDESFPNTLEGVLSAPGQFTTWKNRNIDAATPTDEVYESINDVLSGQTNILPFETVYFGRYAQNNNVELIIENHIFCNK